MNESLTKETFAKIIELEDFQILVTKQTEINENQIAEYFVNQTTMHNGIEYNLALVYEIESKQIEIFYTYSESDAIAFIEHIKPCFLTINTITE